MSDVSALLELSYDAAVRTLDLQERAVEQLRSRTGTLLAASPLTASFLGAETIQHQGGLDTLVVLALVALAVSIVSCVYVLLPTEGLVFSISAPATYEALYEFDDDDDEVRRRLVYWLEEYWRANNGIIEDLGRWFAAAALALTLQLLLWCVALARTI